MDKNIEALKIADKARRSLSKYCSNECKAYCCRDGYLLLTSNEVKLFKDIIKKDLKIMTPKLISNKKRYILDLGLSVEGCPNLINYKCSIHKNLKRPKTCKDFPLFIYGNVAVASKRCSAVEENKLYPYLYKLKGLGFNIKYLDRD